MEIDPSPAGQPSGRSVTQTATSRVYDPIDREADRPRQATLDGAGNAAVRAVRWLRRRFTNAPICEALERLEQHAQHLSEHLVRLDGRCAQLQDELQMRQQSLPGAIENALSAGTTQRLDLAIGEIQTMSKQVSQLLAEGVEDQNAPVNRAQSALAAEQLQELLTFALSHCGSPMSNDTAQQRQPRASTRESDR